MTTSDALTPLQLEAQQFDEENPHVMKALVGLCRGWRESVGPTAMWSINGTFEVLRWERAMSTKGDDYKLNNNFRSWYSREIMDRFPDLVGIFELRELHPPPQRDDGQLIYAGLR